MKPLPVFIGWDDREADAYKVAERSLKRHASIPVDVRPLKLRELQASGLYRRNLLMGVSPQELIDAETGERQTTQFTFTRWLVPSLAAEYALYFDCDFLFRHDVADLIECAPSGAAVSVVKHAHLDGRDRKMWNVRQDYYARKNWSSLALWNCTAPGSQYLTPYRVNHAPRLWLHQFSWLQDSEIGELPASWNWLCGVSGPDADPLAVHYTLGTPDLPGHESDPFADEWRSYL